MEKLKIRLAEDLIEEMMQHYKVRTYRDLADKLDLAYPTISNWKNKGQIDNIVNRMRKEGIAISQALRDQIKTPQSLPFYQDEKKEHENIEHELTLNSIETKLKMLKEYYIATIDDLLEDVEKLKK